MAEKNKFNKPVSFNTKNESDNLILKHVSRRNFSGYVKKLILADIEKGKGEKREIEPVEAVKTDVVMEQPKPTPKPSAADRLAGLKQKQQQKQQRPGLAPGPKMFNQPSN